MVNLYGFETGDRPAVIRVTEDGRILGRRYWDAQGETLGDEQRSQGDSLYRGTLWVSKYQALRALRAVLG
jgi:hypothetical protein